MKFDTKIEKNTNNLYNKRTLNQYFLNNMEIEEKITLDRVDREILSLLQRDARTPIKEIAKKVNLSATPCWKRIKKMQDAGIIRAQVVLLDPVRMNANVNTFVSIRVQQHDPDWNKQFAKVVSDIPEIVEIYRMSGEVDYLMRVVVASIDAYDKLYTEIISKMKNAGLTMPDMTSNFAMEQIKYTTALPVNFPY